MSAAEQLHSVISAAVIDKRGVPVRLNMPGVSSTHQSALGVRPTPLDGKCNICFVKSATGRRQKRGAE